MILTCPACTMRYLVSEGAIGPKGRRVRCASCGNQWHEDPETGLDEELFGEAPAFLEEPSGQEDDDDIFARADALAKHDEDDDLDFQAILRKEIESTPIPQGVHPEPAEHDPVLAQLGTQKSRKKLKLPPGDRLGGFVAAACFYFLIFGLFLVFQPQISRAWPPSNLIYDLVGMKPVMPGEGLALDSLSAELADGKIALKGKILNLRAEDIKLPAVMASIVDDDAKIIDRILIAPPIARIKPEGSVDFDVVYPKLPDGATNVTFAFSFIQVKPSEAVLEPKSADAPPATTDHEAGTENPVLPVPAEAAHTDKPAATHH